MSDLVTFSLAADRDNYNEAEDLVTRVALYKQERGYIQSESALMLFT